MTTIKTKWQQMKRLLPVMSMCFAFLTSNGQTPIANKTYVAQVRASCVRTTDGGYMIYTYRVLAFTKDSVTVSYRVKEGGYPSESANLQKTYSWKRSGNSLTIKDFPEMGKLSIQKDGISGWDKERKEQILYKEEAR